LRIWQKFALLGSAGRISTVLLFHKVRRATIGFEREFIYMSLRHIFAKLLGNTAETAPPAIPYAGPPVKQPPVNATMAAIRASDLDTAVLLMKTGGEVDFGDPAIETQMRVATYEANFEFLQALEERRTVQQAAALRKQTEQDNAAMQEAQGRHLQKMAGIAMAIADGTEEVAAPVTARFRRKMPAA
jgi:hypothetical protein